jgi:hypothetical protein
MNEQIIGTTALVLLTVWLFLHDKETKRRREELFALVRKYRIYFDFWRSRDGNYSLELSSDGHGSLITPEVIDDCGVNRFKQEHDLMWYELEGKNGLRFVIHGDLYDSMAIIVDNVDPDVIYLTSMNHRDFFVELHRT